MLDNLAFNMKRITLQSSKVRSWHGFSTPCLLVFCLFLGGSFPGAILDAEEQPRLRDVVRIQSVNGKERYRFKESSEGEQTVVFRAFAARRWPGGLVPVFELGRSGSLRLGRFPRTGHEGLVEPLFYGLSSPEEETNVAILGRWECRGNYWDGAEEVFDWELTARGTKVVGRFDTDTDFRFASILEGSLRGDQFRLMVQYIDARYELVGLFKDGALKGEWIQVGESGKGHWQAVRYDKMPPEYPANVVPLWPCFREGAEVRYRLEGEMIEAGWTRGEQPLCLVWRARTVVAR